MSPDVLATLPSPDTVLTGRAATERLRLSMQAGPICLLPRTLPFAVATALDQADPEDFPRLDVSGPWMSVRRAAAAASAVEGRAAPVIHWLCDDVTALIALYVEATRSTSVLVRLMTVVDDERRSFRAAPGPFRLVTTYRGPGTEWLPPRLLALTPQGRPLDAGAIRQLDRGTIAMMRGDKGATADRAGVLHRSPAGAGATRLCLTIEEAGA